MFTNYLLINELAYSFRCRFFKSFRYGPLGEVIHRRYYIAISSSRDCQWSHDIYPYSLERCFRWYWVDNIILLQSPSSLAIITSFHIISNIFKHLWPIVTLLYHLKYLVNSSMSCCWAVMK